MNFIAIRDAVAARFAQLSKDGAQLFRTAATPDFLVHTYNSSFTEEQNPIFRKRRVHDCACCYSFIRNVGNVVAIKDDRLISIWDVEVDDPVYQMVASSMAAAVYQHPVTEVFATYLKEVGTRKSRESREDGSVHEWDHFHVHIPAAYQVPEDKVATHMHQARVIHNGFLTSVTEISADAVSTVLDLIAANTIYRGAEYHEIVKQLAATMNAMEGMNQHQRDLYSWVHGSKINSISVAYNSAIGKLMQYLTEGRELESAVRAYEEMVAPGNYKRSSAVVTPKMLAAAKEALKEHHLDTALERRYAVTTDLKVTDLLFVDRNTASKINRTALDNLEVQVTHVSDKIQEVPLAKFLSDVLPRTRKLEVLLENHHAQNMVSLIAPTDPTAPNLFKWDNGFSWSYAGDVTDAIKERVKRAGGATEGYLCCRLSWDHDDDLDFHMMEHNYKHHLYFGTRRRLSPAGGILDVDANGIDGIVPEPVENIVYAKAMPKGNYELIVNNYSRRSDGVGFEVQIEHAGKTLTFAFDSVLRERDSTLIATFVSDGQTLTIDTHGNEVGHKSRLIWSLPTYQYHRVQALMLSPNHWEQQIGNKHYFFMLENCVNPAEARGFYNEFLHSKLHTHRKAMELIGSRIKTATATEQLSGIGISETRRESLTCRVTGETSTRTIKVLF